MIIHDIFTEHFQQKDKTEISITQMKREMGELQDKIVLYGAGSAGIAFLHYLQDAGIEPICFSDGDAKKWGTLCENLPVVDYREIKHRIGADALVIVCINTDGQRYCKSFADALRVEGHHGVHKNLKDVGCTNVIDYTYFRRCRELFQGERYNLPSCSDVRLMERCEEEIVQAYSMLEDNKSREIFEKLVYFRMVDDSIKITTEKQERQYFEYEFFPRSKEEIFVDCGAYNGISLKTFLETNDNMFQYYYGIEPDENNFANLQKVISELPEPIQQRIRLVKKAVYNESGKRIKMYSLCGPGSFISETGNEEAEGIRIDDLVDSRGASFIKMNIEGAEVQALEGAEKIIKQYKPKLAIAGYHRTQDLWKVPLIMKKFNPEYKISLRSYMNHISFVYYAFM